MIGRADAMYFAPGCRHLSLMYQSPTTPMRHQTEALKRLRSRPTRPSSKDVMAWLMDKGTGKSKVILDEWQDRVSSRELDLLVVMAPKGAYRN